MDSANILVVEDEWFIAEDIKNQLLDMGHRVAAIAANAHDALAQVKEHHLNLVLMDIVLQNEEIDGIDIADKIHREFSVPVVYVTAYSDPKLLQRAKQTSPFGYVIKPFSREALYATIEIALHKHQQQLLLQERERRYRNLVEHLPDMFIIVDIRGFIVYASPASMQIFGIPSEQMLQQHVSQYISASAATKIQTVIDAESLRNINDSLELEIERPNGTYACLELTIGFIYDDKRQIAGWQGIIRDITERKYRQSRLAQEQKAESLANLATGIAHEFNNILSPILIRSEMAMADASYGKELQYNIEQIFETANRARKLTQKILAFNQKQPATHTKIKLGELIQQVLWKISIPQKIRVNCEKMQTCEIVSNREQIGKVLLQLVKNACDAMPNGGNLTICLQQTDVKAGSKRFPGLQPGLYCRLMVSDTGTGITPEIMGRIFEPYFSKKQLGKKTGMGLALVHTIIKNLGGDIAVDSELGKGSSFHVFFPQNEFVEHRTATVGDRPHILCVDDDEIVLDAQKLMLKKLGYQVTQYQSSKDAWNFFRQHSDQFDMVITDMMMPEMNGLEFAECIRQLQPDMPVVMCTGYSGIISKQQAIAKGINAYLMKPISFKTLASTIDGILSNVRPKHS